QVYGPKNLPSLIYWAWSFLRIYAPTPYGSSRDMYTIAYFGSLSEFQTIKFFIKYLKYDDIFYDIGANYGFYTLLAQEFIKEGQIHAFEPLPEVFEILEMNVKPQDFKNTFLNQVAVSDVVGEIEFFSCKGDSSRSSMIKRDLFGGSHVIKVKTITLDEYIKTHKPPTIMKIDIEGAEYLALKGGENLLKSHSPLIIMETLGDDIIDASLRLNATNFLKDLGYKPYSLLSNGDLEETNYDIFINMKGGHNYVFIK
ncbi:MAG: FkbM family methyltransferase, partial [Aquificaceae bacterium]